MGARAYRIVIVGANAGGYTSLAALELRATAGGAAQTGGTPFGSPEYTDGSTPPGAVGPAKAFDGDDATIYHSTNNAWPVELGMDYGPGANVEVEEFAIRARAAIPGNSAPSDQAPRYFWLESTNDDASTAVRRQFARWYRVSPRSSNWSSNPYDQTGWAAGELRVFTGPFTPATLTVTKLAASAHVGDRPGELAVAKLRPELLIGSRTGELAVSKMRVQVLSGAEPGRITVSKLAVSALEGALPQRVTVSKLTVSVLLGAQPRARSNHPQIIGG